ncbi:class-V aminotransferase [Streptococcus pneumoniae]|nr:class-V aminotransferase [Streptococcus pneumoniae]
MDFAPVDKKGLVDVEALAGLIRPDTILVSIMAVNNEIGSIQPIEAISEFLADKPTISFHVDAVQALAKIPTEKYLTERVDCATSRVINFMVSVVLALLYQIWQEDYTSSYRWWPGARLSFDN